jgi:CheY-like chemotaxis protein
MPGKRILVVDDESMVLDAVRMTLTHFGYEVETVPGGAEALQKLAGAGFDLVITDMKMPVMTGDQLAKEIRKRSPDTPIVLLTGYPPEVYPRDVNAVLLKPFSTQELRSTVAALVGGRDPRSASGSPEQAV